MTVYESETSMAKLTLSSDASPGKALPSQQDTLGNVVASPIRSVLAAVRDSGRIRLGGGMLRI